MKHRYSITDNGAHTCDVKKTKIFLRNTGSFKPDEKIEPLSCFFITSVICAFQDWSLEIVTPKSLASVTTFMHSPPITTRGKSLLTEAKKKCEVPYICQYLV